MNYLAEEGLRVVSEYGSNNTKPLEVLTWEDFELIGKFVFLGRDHRVESVKMLSTEVFEITLQERLGTHSLEKMLREHELPEPTEVILHLPTKIFVFNTAKRSYEFRISYK